jgi:hypothetical protein
MTQDHCLLKSLILRSALTFGTTIPTKFSLQKETMLRRKRIWFGYIPLFLALLSVGNCAEAVFSLDAQSVFLATPKGLLELDLTTKSARLLKAPAKLDRDMEYGVSLSTAGDLLFAGKEDAKSYDLAKQTWVSLCRAPAGTSFDDIACNPVDDSIVLQTTDQKGLSAYWRLAKGTSHPIQIKLRRVQSLSGFTFDSQGRLYFGYNGDLWMGSICDVPEDKESGYWVCGIRIGPVADLETNFETPTNQGVQMTAPAADGIYIHLLRLGGSGWGTIASLRTPSVIFTDGEAVGDDLEKRLALYQDELKSVRFLGKNGSYSFLCASRSGTRVFYRSEEPQSEKMKVWLVSDGKREEIGDDNLIGLSH